MPIVSSEIVKAKDRGNGTQRVFEHHIDHNGDLHEHRYICPLDYDVAKALSDRVAKLEAELVEMEMDSVQAAVESGESPSDIVVKHLSVAEKATAVIRGLMKGDPQNVIPTALFVQGLTNQQIQNIFTQGQRIRIRDRQNYVLDNQAVFSADVREEI